MVRHSCYGIWIFFFFFLLASPGRAEFAWFTPYEKLELRAGGEYLSTNENFSSDGLRVPLRLNGDNIKISETKFYVEPEYGFANNWAVRARLGFLTNATSSDTGRTNTTQLSGSGLGDFTVAVKHRLRAMKPLLTLEIATSVPTYTRTVTLGTELIMGDGSIDTQIGLHGIYSVGRFVFAFSPYFTLRTGGYAQRIGANVGAGVRFPPVFILPYFESYAALGDTLLFDSSENTHDAIGAAQSYLRLSGSPSAINFGLKVGGAASKATVIEGFFRTSVWGNRSAAFYQLGLNILMKFDFTEPSTKLQTKEVPFESNQEDLTK